MEFTSGKCKVLDFVTLLRKQRDLGVQVHGSINVVTQLDREKTRVDTPAFIKILSRGVGMS